MSAYDPKRTFGFIAACSGNRDGSVDRLGVACDATKAVAIARRAEERIAL
jgi:hypothetical protein